MVFAGYSGFLHYLQLSSHELATIGINVTKNKIQIQIPKRIKMCVVMAALIWDTSLQKSTEYSLKRKSFSHKICNIWDLGRLENVDHIVMQCQYCNDERK